MHGSGGQCGGLLQEIRPTEAACCRMKKRYVRPAIRKLTPVDVGRRLRKLRAQIGTPAEAARLLGIDAHTVSRFEKATDVPPWYVIALSALARGRSPRTGGLAS